ncbi:hypothetical protein [Caproicibacter fermentans]|uniref:YokE-like PH domain-containing protein n=1 Tax=Caproicibacter fermentans TaxID=2576756 RepID=A0A7G8T651_9FIRM|nr:hypothetical protein [Caproicibacter fermentans]QNK39092.1 hypothetical protein HCR03_09815 [Caproicibacter fermentans]
MRGDVEKLLKQDGVHLWQADRNRMEALCGMLAENESVKLVLVGQLNVYYGAVPVPEQINAAVCITDLGILIYGKVWKNEISLRKPWRKLSSFDTSAGKISGVHLALSDAGRKYLFTENYRGRVSEQHKDELEKIKQAYYYTDQE